VDNGAEEDRERDGWIDVVKHNMEDLQLNVEDAENRAEWRRRTRVDGGHSLTPIMPT